MAKKRIGFAGAGFACAVLARELAQTGNFECVVFDERNHVAGNCHTSRDASTGVMVHEYGPHIFNTSREDVWEYVNRWTKFGPYVNRVKAVTERGVYSLPINLLTINQFFDKRMNPAEAREFIASLGDSTIAEPESFEEQALKFVGRELYENFFLGYTKKQWGVDPKRLPAAILKRLPVRFNYDDGYFNQKYQGIPLDGYTAIVEKILDCPGIEVKLGTRFDPKSKDEYDHVFWSGPLDAYFDYKLGRLGYRTLVFEKLRAKGDYQGNAVINYCEEKVPFTRISEHKHFTPWEEHENTICFKEFSKLAEEGDVPYYPLRLNDDKAILQDYVRLAESEEKVTFCGRLGTYRYLDMHQVIGESLDLAQMCLRTNLETSRWPSFSVRPL
ncbi:MAG: UDP-galactopyranose mutase [Bdellovibrionia bacterium]